MAESKYEQEHYGGDKDSPHFVERLRANRDPQVRGTLRAAGNAQVRRKAEGKSHLNPSQFDPNQGRLLSHAQVASTIAPGQTDAELSQTHGAVIPHTPVGFEPVHASAIKTATKRLGANPMEKAVGNRLKQYDRAPPAQREKSREWYDGARQQVGREAERSGVTPPSMRESAAIASAKMPWSTGDPDTAKYSEQSTKMAGEVVRHIKGGGAPEDFRRPSTGSQGLSGVQRRQIAGHMARGHPGEGLQLATEDSKIRNINGSLESGHENPTVDLAARMHYASDRHDVAIMDPKGQAAEEDKPRQVVKNAGADRTISPSEANYKNWGGLNSKRTYGFAARSGTVAAAKRDELPADFQAQTWVGRKEEQSPTKIPRESVGRDSSGAVNSVHPHLFHEQAGALRANPDAKPGAANREPALGRPTRASRGKGG
jgi:hypothetical protein